jgi:YbgC/YbaW family acyl-CoA thioester hydrolase
MTDKSQPSNPTRAQFRHLERLRVRWAEVDLQKIVFNGHYLMYFDTAVAGYWRAMALPYHDTMHALQGDLYVRKATVEYLASAQYDDSVVCGVRVGRMGNSSMTLQCALFKQDHLLVHGELVYVFADPATQTSRPLPQPLRQVLQDFEGGGLMLQVQCIQGQPGLEAVADLRSQLPADEQFSLHASMGGVDDAMCHHVVLRNAMGVCVATARLRPSASTGVIDALAVSPALRGSGLAVEVLAHALNHATQLGSQATIVLPERLHRSLGLAMQSHAQAGAFKGLELRLAPRTA